MSGKGSVQIISTRDGASGHADAEPGGEALGLRPGREDDRVGADRAGRGLDGGDAPPGRPEARDRRVLADAATEVLERPRVGLDGALGVRVAAEVEVEAADRVVPDDRDELPDLLGVERLGPEAPLGGDPRRWSGRA